ncbi:hypothetical protein F511_18962 [Dorcoceras hygrometricum]|uniref:CAF1B/HIR1 beta-propeller domain-containing protein n=1 Tax=Dorcoceras hygrometricum TaxID=472368 RepID=A0A2Z7D684_9LAMI|nr:hypothetical protein F511_18962 [Dorcoceras hygrometricum]
MKGGTVQINWHDTKPVLTCDFHPQSGILATGGADYDIKLWATMSGKDQNKAPGVTYQSSLSHHCSAVNVLRFSPSGARYVISYAFILFVLSPLGKFLSNAEVDLRLMSITSYIMPISKIAGEQIASGADGGELILWKAHSTDAGSVHQILDGHFHYVQGVAWDPLMKYAASLSSDRTCRIYVNKKSKSKAVEKTNYVCQHVIAKAEPRMAEESKSTRSHLFHDETLPSFFRRLSWSPDGSFLLVPAVKVLVPNEPGYHIVGWPLDGLRLQILSCRPAIMLPGASRPVVAVRFCPVTLKLRGSKTSPFFKLPYRLIFAVATLNSLYLYDTESVQPLVVIAGVHYAAITDIAWSPTGNYLALSSQDGYCTLLEFESQELGSPVKSPAEEKQADVTEVAQVLEPIANDKGKVSIDDKMESIENFQREDKSEDGKHTSPSTTIIPSNPCKPAKRRITPMAVD